MWICCNQNLKEDIQKILFSAMFENLRRNGKNVYNFFPLFYLETRVGETRENEVRAICPVGLHTHARKRNAIFSLTTPTQGNF